MTKPTTALYNQQQEKIKDLAFERDKLKADLAAANSRLALHDKYCNRMIKYWRDLTGVEMCAVTILEAAEYIMKQGAKAETLQEEIDEMTEMIDEVNVANEWLTQRLGQYE